MEKGDKKYGCQCEICPRPEFDRRIEVPFEDIRLPILEGYDWICRVVYGDDHMVPVIGHAHSVYKEQMGILTKKDVP